MPTPTLTTNLFCQLVDAVTAAGDNGIGSAATGYGLGDSSQLIGNDWGLSGGLRTAQATALTAGASNSDVAFIARMNQNLATSVAQGNYQFVLKSILSKIVLFLASECANVGTVLNITSIVDIPSFCAYYNTGAGGPWNALLPPQFQTFFGLAYTNGVLPATALYAPTIANMGQITVGGSFVAGGTVNTTLYAGEGQIQAQVSSFTGTSGTLTVTGNSRDSTGATHTGRTWTVTVTGNGNFTLVPTITGDICTAVTSINLPASMSAGTAVIAGLAPAGRTYPPTPPAAPFSSASMPSNVPVLLNAASSGAPSGVVWAGVVIAGTTAPTDTRYLWWNTSVTPNALFYYNPTTLTWIQVNQSGTYSLLSSNFTAGTVGANNLYINPASPNTFPVGVNVEVLDSTLAHAYYQVTAMSSTQVAAPLTPTISAQAGSTGLLAGNYEVVCTATNAVGETIASGIATVTITAGQQIHVNAEALPTGATGLNWYMSTAAGGTTLGFIVSNTGAAFNITALPGGGAANPPTTNTTMGLLMTRLSWDTSASPTYSFTTANASFVVLAGIPGATGAAGNPRNTTLNGSFTAGNVGTSYTINVATGTGTYFVVGDIIHIFDGTKGAYYLVTATAANSVTATRQSVPSDPNEATAGYLFASATPVAMTGPPGPAGPTLTMQEDVFTVAGAGPYTLSFTPNAIVEEAYLDGRRFPISSFVISSNQISLGSGLTPSLYSQLIFYYSH